MKEATLSWSRSEGKWILRVSKGDEWVISVKYGIKKGEYLPLYDETDDYIHESVLHRIASLQERGYKVTVIV